MTDVSALGRLPEGFLAFTREHDGAEGFVGTSYIAFWPLDRIRDLNDLLQVGTFAPGLLLVATNGNGEGYAVDQYADPPIFVNVPLVGLGHMPPTPVADDLEGLLRWLGGSTIEPADESAPTTGKIVWELTPVLMGGSPTDPANRRLVSLPQALEMAAWWNHRVGTLSPAGDIQ